MPTPYVSWATSHQKRRIRTKNKATAKRKGRRTTPQRSRRRPLSRRSSRSFALPPTRALAFRTTPPRPSRLCGTSPSSANRTRPWRSWRSAGCDSARWKARQPASSTERMGSGGGTIPRSSRVGCIMQAASGAVRRFLGTLSRRVALLDHGGFHAVLVVRRTELAHLTTRFASAGIISRSGVSVQRRLCYRCHHRIGCRLRHVGRRRNGRIRIRTTATRHQRQAQYHGNQVAHGHHVTPLSTPGKWNRTDAR